jgi:hypothetical protein
MSTFLDHIEEKAMTVDAIKNLLSFSASPEQKIREQALSGLFKILDRKFAFLVTMPSFIYHILGFPLKPLSPGHLEQLINWTARFLESTQSLPDYILPQLIWLHANVPPKLKPKAVACLVAATRFENVRSSFPPEFWRGTTADFALNLPIFRAFVPALPKFFADMIHTLTDMSASAVDALRLLVECTRILACAEIVVTRLPIQNKSSPALLFQLYWNLSEVEGSSLVIGDELEFYMVCTLTIASEFQNDVCRLIRKIEINPVLIENSGLLQQIALLIYVTSESPALWSLMSVVFTISHDRFFASFTSITPKLTEFLKGTNPELRTGAFLCLVNFAQYSEGVDKIALLLTAAEWVNNGSIAVQNICCEFLSREIAGMAPETLRKVARKLLEELTGTPGPKVVEFAGMLSAATEQVPGFDDTLLAQLYGVSRPGLSGQRRSA